MGTNFLGITAKKSTDIKYEGQFAVDWLDHNVLIFRDRAIRIVSLLRPGYTREIYNGSKEVRNIVVSTRGFFFAWIENDNNIRRMSKDSLQAPIVHTEKSKIFCMTLDEETKRFFYYIGGQGFTLQRSVRAGGGKKNKGKKTTTTAKPDKDYYFVLYSKDFEGRYPPEREGSVRVRGVKSEPVQVAKYRGAVFVILQEETKDNNGDFIYRLGQVMRSGEFKEIVENPNWRITSVLKSTGIDANVADLCGRQLNRCPYLCVHVSEDQARCLCRDDAPGCTDHPMTVPADERTSTVAAAVQRQSYVVTTLIVVLLPVVFLLAYCLYTNYLAADEEVAGEGGSSTGSSLSAGSAVGSAIGAPVDNALKQQQQKPSGALHALINWAGLGSADVSSSIIEGEEGELIGQKMSTIGGRNTSTVAAVTAAPEPSSAVSEVAESEPPKKRKKRHKHRHKQRTAAKSSAT